MTHPAFTLASWETIGILIVVIGMLVSNRVRVDFIGVFILLALGITGIVSEKELFSGFGSASNIVANQLLVKEHIKPIPLFSILPVGLSLLIIAMLFILAFGQFLVPDTGATSGSGTIGIEDYLTELHVSKSSKWHDKPLKNIQFLKIAESMSYEFYGIIRLTFRTPIPC
ncbi:hypothetical protein [Alicyclobacillus dauci]|uniref:Uncharacterized protein n=1 Tax=Alicyclobacillus dauci TaxID=1475485 RepID=A0ABY6Z338_9BACL|nr:hypothetical protein [Alicyclobacillus dauci]WAH37165.1 hypothetical protein NZD86_01020 [Alicyclobacillus dauci]